MKQYLEQKDGSYKSNIGTIPNSQRSPDYQRMKAEEAGGLAEIVPYAEPEPSIEDQIAVIEATITPRNIRAALLSESFAITKITEAEASIEVLRAQL